MLNPLLISHTLLAATIPQLLPLPVTGIPTVPVTSRSAPNLNPNEGPILGANYTIEPITFQLPTSPSPNSPTINITGTIQQAIQAAEKVNPAWRSDFAQAIQKFKSENLLAAVEVDHWDCSTGAPTGYNDVSQILWALALVKGKPTLGAGRCGRVSCADGAAVWWCNNSGRARKELDSYGTITNAAYEILDNCPVRDKALGPKRLVHGQVYLVGEWHIIIGGNEC